MNRLSFLRLGAALAAGVIFSFGLSVSGMINPARVIGFLNIASGHWDPSLAFVMGGRVAGHHSRNCTLQAAFGSSLRYGVSSADKNADRQTAYCRFGPVRDRLGTWRFLSRPCRSRAFAWVAAGRFIRACHGRRDDYPRPVARQNPVKPSRYGPLQRRNRQAASVPS
ncbi:unnamed protein product [Brucella canis str. Oliveri]|nr:unnamed protein product [Brucella canis str. Oliveri]